MPAFPKAALCMADGGKVRQPAPPPSEAKRVTDALTSTAKRRAAGLPDEPRTTVSEFMAAPAKKAR